MKKDKGLISVYTAGPDGFSEATKLFLDEKVIPWLQGLGLVVNNPWTMTSDDEVMAVLGMPDGPKKDLAKAELRIEIGRRNHELGVATSTFILANFDGQEVDSGTVAEATAGSVLGKRVFARRSDFRQSGELGAKINLQVVWYIEELGKGCIVPSFVEQRQVVEAYVRELIADGYQTLHTQ